MAGDVLVVRVNDTTHLDIHYAEGTEMQSAKGNFVLEPKWGHFQIRYPNSLFLTLKNNDAVKQKLVKPIRIDYWQDLFNPLEGKQPEELTEPIPPSFGLDLKSLITPKSGSALDNSGEDDGDIWLWLSFVIALIAVGGVGLGYYIMRIRKKKMQLQKALAEGKVSLKGPNDQPATDEDSPDKLIEMQGMEANSARQG